MEREKTVSGTGRESGRDFRESAIGSAIGSSARFLRGLLLIAIAAYLLSGIFTVKPEEKAVVLRFGRIQGNTPADRVKEPGIHFAFPYPVDQVVKVPVKMVREVDLTTFAKAGESIFIGKNIESVHSRDTINPAREGYILTGDTNIILLELLVRYQVSDVEKYLFSVADPEAAIREALRASTIEVVGSMRVDDILSKRRSEARNAILEETRTIVDSVEAGVSVLALEISQVTPPEVLAEDFKDVTSALVEKSALIQEANGYHNSKIPEARSRANRLLRDADIFRTQILQKAASDSSRFVELLAEYQKQPRVVAGRLYAETMEIIWPTLDKRVILPSRKGGRHKVFISPSSGD